MNARCITIDGPAGAGKSTLGELLAQRLGYLYIDTGVMYRAVAWLALQLNIDIHDKVALAELAQNNFVVISHPTVPDGRQYTVMLREHDITWDIRRTDVTQVVPHVSAFIEVRKHLIAQQRSIARQHAVVMVGRDIGTVVLPNADLKIFLNATPEERAARRYKELMKPQGDRSGILPSYQEVLRDIQRRDNLDSVNMQPASDALEIMTDGLSVVQLLDLIMAQIHRAIPEVYTRLRSSS